MSLTALLRTEAVEEAFKALSNNPFAPMSEPLRVESTAPPRCVGTAFDYALRIGLGRRHDLPVRPLPFERYCETDPSPDIAIVETAWASDNWSASACRALMTLTDHDHRARGHAPSDGRRTSALAVCREVAALVAITDLNLFSYNERMVIGPSFGDGSNAVGGADADLVIDDMLVDFKTSTDARTTDRHVHQLLAYAVLANRYGVDGFLEGEVTRLGLYSARWATLSVVVLESVASEHEQAQLLEVLLDA